MHWSKVVSPSRSGVPAALTPWRRRRHKSLAFLRRWPSSRASSSTVVVGSSVPIDSSQCVPSPLSLLRPWRSLGRLWLRLLAPVLCPSLSLGQPRVNRLRPRARLTLSSCWTIIIRRRAPFPRGTGGVLNTGVVLGHRYVSSIWSYDRPYWNLAVGNVRDHEEHC